MHRMVSTDFLIIGQGVAGLLVAFELIKKGRSVYVYNEKSENAASRVAGAVINPVSISTGKVKNDLQIQTALKTYPEIERFLNVQFLNQKALLLFNRQSNFSKPLSSQASFLNNYFQNFDTIDKIEHVYHVKNEVLFECWFNYLAQNNILKAEKFRFAECIFKSDHIQYENVYAKNIIFCEGAKGARNPIFPDLPFNKNRGNVLWLSIPGLPEQFIYQFKHRLIPLGNNKFWLGSNYQWVFEDLLPDERWRKQCMEELKGVLKLPFQYIGHSVAERPTTAGQRVIMKQHTTRHNVFFFNGLGTQGFTTGPYYAQMFVKEIMRPAGFRNLQA